MARLLDNRVWLLLVGMAIALTIACSSSTTTDNNDSGTEPTTDAQTGG